MDLNRPLDSLQYQTQQPSNPELYDIDVYPEYPSIMGRVPPRPLQAHDTVPPPPDPLSYTVIGPRQPKERNPPYLRQSSLVGVGCKPCGFFPKAPDQRKKMERHKICDKHRRRTNQDVMKRMLCPALSPDGASLCGRRFGRRDNLGQHVKKDHGMELAECGQVRYELEDDDEAEMWDL